MISRSSMHCTLVVLAFAAAPFAAAGQEKATPLRLPAAELPQAELPKAELTDLRVDDLATPLGIDDPAPHFSWQLNDPARGARQAAYEVQVFSSPALAAANKPDWSSGRIASNQSLNVRYAGPALQPSHRYTWRVKVWVAHGAASESAPSAAALFSAESNWETGLLHQEAWRADWIGYETAEEDAVRHAPAVWITTPDARPLGTDKTSEQHVAYRLSVTINKPVASATLFATGQDTVSAWINDHQVLTAQAFPPWKQMPWKKFVRADAASALAPGANTLAIETVHYIANPNGMAAADAPPMIATLVVVYADGTTETFNSGTGWKTALHASEGWQQTGFDDTSWQQAVVWQARPGPFSTPLGHPWIPDSVKVLRHDFNVGSPIVSARLYATALGAYELLLNGRRVGDDVLAPGWTDYRQHVTYQTYDVTAQIAIGSNVIGAMLAPGWYSTPLEWFQQPNNYGDTPPALRAQLRIEHADGSVEWVVSNTQWVVRQTEISSSEIYDGETQNARQSIPMEGSWGSPQLKTEGWPTAIAISPKPVALEAQAFPSIRVERTLEPRFMAEPKPGVYVYDFGQNFSGVEHIKVSGPGGTDVRVRFSEIVNPDGTLYTDNLRTAKATDHFILKGYGLEEFTPQFTFHGFRYLEITGLPAAPGNNAVSAAVIHTDAPLTAKLETGSPMINQLWKNILWGQRSNFVGIPSDCPQRDERLGWMADAQVFWRAASYNMDLTAFSRKFSADMRGTQVGTPYFGIYSPGTARPNMGTGAGWSDAGVVIPWTSWLQTGDTQIVEDNWAAMQKYLDAINAANPDGLWLHEAGTPFGDWLSPEGKTNYGLIATAYWAYDVTLMRQMAHATGRKEDESKYAELFAKIRAAFIKKYVHDDGFVAGADNSASPFGQINNPNAKSHGGDTQTGYVLALHMNLLPAELRDKAAAKLAAKIEANNGMLATGFLGTPYLLEELTKAGYTTLAYKLLLNTEYPSWGYLVGHGATTMWERWNGDQMKSDPSMNSYNHYAYGAVADWIYRYAAGIDTTPLDAGFHTIVLHPVFDERLGWIRFDYDSRYGPIHSDWKASPKSGEAHSAEWHLTLPANTTGWLPLTAEEAAKYRLEGSPLKSSTQVKAETRDGQSGFVLEPGQYTFSVVF
jgi:alpha-L-rhamnosidase